MPERELTFADAIREALAEEMRRDPGVFIIGEDVAEAGTPFKVLTGLVEEFGTRARAGLSHLRARFQRVGRRRGDNRHASGGGYHVRRFPHAGP